jgi:hypothetical protein
MPFNEVWEKTTVFLPTLGAHPEPPIYYPPEIWPPQPPDLPPWWPGHVEHPIVPGPSHPIVIPPAPPEERPPVLPDLNSPGFCAHVLASDNSYRWGWVQLSWDTSPGHVPQPPDQGLPGYWIVAYVGTFGMQPVWIPVVSWSGRI